MRTVAIGIVFIALVAGGTTYYLKVATADGPATFKTAVVKRGELLVTIGATGTVEPQDVVDVGAQVQGRVTELGTDPRGQTDPLYKGKAIDYTTEVEEGTILARIDDAVYLANRDQAQAALDRANADQLQLEAKRDQAAAEWERAQKLHDLKLNSLSADLRRSTPAAPPAAAIKGISDSDYDLAKANYEVAKANAAVGLTAIKQAQAALQLAKTNLGYTVIQSPVKGTIIDRRVNIGQTVVAALNAPSMFLIGKDLTKMQVWASVNEADIGRIQAGMPAQFSVAAHPEKLFEGVVEKIRLNAQSTQNVVSYTVEINFDNSAKTLMPYGTAEIKFIVDRRSDVLLVPNSAVAFQPRPQDVAPSARDEFASGFASASSEADRRSDKSAANGDKGPPSDGKAARRPKGREGRGTLWVKEEEYVRPIQVEVGATDGTLTEVSGPDLTEGMEVVVTEIHAEQATSDTKNPFAPQFFRGGRAQGQGSGAQGSGRGPKGG